MSGTVKPTGVTVNRQTRELTLMWNGGHENIYAFSLLRYACPCTECQGGHENIRIGPDSMVFESPVVDSPATRVHNEETVSTYAISIAWEDGHHNRIYSRDYLSKLCSCPVYHPESNDV